MLLQTPQKAKCGVNIYLQGQMAPSPGCQASLQSPTPHSSLKSPSMVPTTQTSSVVSPLLTPYMYMEPSPGDLPAWESLHLPTCPEAYPDSLCSIPPTPQFYPTPMASSSLQHPHLYLQPTAHCSLSRLANMQDAWSGLKRPFMAVHCIQNNV